MGCTPRTRWVTRTRQKPVRSLRARNKKDAALTTSLFVSFPTLFSCSPHLLTNLQPAEIVLDHGTVDDLRFHFQPAEIVLKLDTFGFDDLSFHFGCSFENLVFWFGSYFRTLDAIVAADRYNSVNFGEPRVNLQDLT